MNTRQWPRYPFIAIVYASDPSSKLALTGRTSDLSLGGCYVDTLNPLPKGAEINVEIVHMEESFLAKGIVVHTQPEGGMGINFIDMDPQRKKTLENWLEALRLASDANCEVTPSQ